MISELVSFAVPPGMTREQVIEGMREVAPKWRRNPDLIRKTFLYDPGIGQTGALYLWPDRESAERAHDEAWRARIREKYGSEPVIRYFETPLVIDNALGAIIEPQAGGQPGPSAQPTAVSSEATATLSRFA